MMRTVAAATAGVCALRDRGRVGWRPRARFGRGPVFDSESRRGAASAAGLFADGQCQQGADCGS